MMDENKPIACNKCGNDKFVVQESTVGSLYIGCSKCGKGIIFGGGIYVRDVVSLLKEDKTADETIVDETESSN